MLNNKRQHIDDYVTVARRDFYYDLSDKVGIYARTKCRDHLRFRVQDAFNETYRDVQVELRGRIKKL